MTTPSALLPRVLAVDDEPAILATFRRVFRGEIELVTEQDPVRALALLITEKFDAIFVDYAMPRMTGVELLEQMRPVWPTVPTFLVTAHSPTESIADAVRRGVVTEVIAKPWSRDAVRLLLRTLSRG